MRAAELLKSLHGPKFKSYVFCKIYFHCIEIFKTIKYMTLYVNDVQ
jgi:hypothetical protein